MAEQATGGEQGQQGGEMDGIGAAASQAYGEALEGGASPQEAFEAAGAAAQEVATEMRVPQADFDQGREAASGGFADAMVSGASPGEALALQWKLLKKPQTLVLIWDLLLTSPQLVT